MTGHPSRVGAVLLSILLAAIFVVPASGLIEKRITTIHIKAKDGGPEGFGEVNYLQQGSKIELLATGTGHDNISDLLSEAVASDTVFVNIYHEIAQIIALGSTKNVMVDGHLRSHGTAQWHWRDAGNFEIELWLSKNVSRFYFLTVSFKNL